jgi:hypothetical protein
MSLEFIIHCHPIIQRYVAKLLIPSLNKQTENKASDVCSGNTQLEF